jgi:non-homologous end joining protein Ku
MNEKISVVLVKKWLSEKEMSAIYLPAYFYLASDKQGKKLYAFFIAKENLNDALEKGCETLTESEKDIVRHKIKQEELFK